MSEQARASMTKVVATPESEPDRIGQPTAFSDRLKHFTLPSAMAAVLTALVFVLVLQFILIFLRSINWDEFHHYNLIYRLRAGTLGSPLQTFEARLFSWLPLTSSDVITQIQTARVAMFGCELVTLTAIFGVARRFAGPMASLFCVLAYISGGEVFLRGFSYRPDAPAAAALMTALWLLTTRRLTVVELVATAALVGFAGILTIKSVFYLPAFAGVALLRWGEAEDRRAFVARMAALALLTALSFLALLLAHRAGLPTGSLARGQAIVGDSASKMFSSGLLPKRWFLLEQILMAPILSAVLAAAVFGTLRSKASRFERLAVAGLLLPPASVLVYTNSFPYFYAFILPPAAAAASIALERLRRGPFVCALSAAMLLNAALIFAVEPRDVLQTQRKIIAAVQEMFPTPVAYFSSTQVIGDYPNPIPFMVSGWGLEDYKQQGRPQFLEAMERQRVPLLLIFSPYCALCSAVEDTPGVETLLPRDAAALHDNYVQEWGPIWVAGKRIAAGTAPITVTVLIPGDYTVEGPPLSIDGVSREAGGVVGLDRGAHVIGGPRSGPSVLRWGDHLTVPRGPPPEGAVFAEF
ncbi:MAG: hypothetical protein ACREEB_18130 [Caulobacteraceae bacterium]